MIIANGSVTARITGAWVAALIKLRRGGVWVPRHGAAGGFGVSPFGTSPFGS